MTETGRRLRRLGAPHVRARALAVVLGGLGAALAAAALGLALAPAVSGVTLAWALVVASAAGAIWALRWTRRAAAAPVLAGLIERGGRGARGGSMGRGVRPTPARGARSSPALLPGGAPRCAAPVAAA